MDLTELTFRQLADLRLYLRELQALHRRSLRVYYDPRSGGFRHKLDEKPKPNPDDFSRSSTATCVISLIATDQWRKQPAPEQEEEPWRDSEPKLINGFLDQEWASAGLPADNLFTVAFCLEAATELRRVAPGTALDDRRTQRWDDGVGILQKAVASGPKALNVQEYPPSTYIAQLVVRTLKKLEPAFKDVDHRISEWAEQEINKQIALLTRDDKTADVFQLAYGVILLANLVEPVAALTPDQEFVIDAALSLLFERQRSDGTWPLSRPLFHYPSVGSAHCFDYEMLVQLLSEPSLRNKMLRFIPQLAKSADALHSYFPLGRDLKGRGWSSGHHPQLRGPESWSTASVYHFAYAFERVLAEQIRIATFQYLGTPYTSPREPEQYVDTLPGYFLDCEITIAGEAHSLKGVVSEKILRPLISAEQTGIIQRGGKLPDKAPVSIIFFGPPGTSKTELAKMIANRLGWPPLTIDASQFLKEGMDGVYAEADTIFGMLAIAEQVVVLLDEFDEMVRAREENPDVLSRFLTTAMLPKLHKIHDNRRLVFIVATNHIDWFDLAIRRPGRFDVILQVMPPTAPEKRRRWPQFNELARGGQTIAKIDEALGPLTFLETSMLVDKLGEATSEQEKRKLLAEAAKGCTMNSSVQPNEDSEAKPPARSRGRRKKQAKRETWADVSDRQSEHIRVP